MRSRNKFIFPIQFMISILLLNFILIGCEYKSNQNSASLLRTHIITPENLINASNSRTSFVSNVNKDAYRIVTYINGDCYCSIEDLLKWERIYRDHFEEMNKFSIEFYVYSADYHQFVESLEYNDILKNEFRILLDKSNEFRELNKLNINEENISFLTDSDNQIIAIGDFLNERNVRLKFFKNHKNNFK